MFRAVAGIVLALMLIGVASANLLVNPGFEIGSATGSAPTAWWNYGSSGQQNWNKHSGSNSYVFYGWVDGGFGGLGQDISTNLTIGQTISFSTYGMFEANFTSSQKEMWMQIEYWTNNATVWSRQDKVSVYDPLAANRGNWNQITIVSTNITPNVVLIKPVIGFGNATNVGGSQSAYFDDTDLTIAGAIPEPMSAMLLGLGLYGATWLRRLIKK